MDRKRESQQVKHKTEIVCLATLYTLVCDKNLLWFGLMSLRSQAEMTIKN